jgi:hypothetical protein
MYDDHEHKRSNDEARYVEIVMMAQAFLWRAEVNRVQFGSVVHTLQALGLINEMEAAHIWDAVEDLYPEEDREPTQSKASAARVE